MIVGRPPPVDGEVLAILHGISVSRAKDWSKLIIESDNSQVIHALTQGVPTLASFGAIVDDCLAFKSFFRHIFFLVYSSIGQCVS